MQMRNLLATILLASTLVACVDAPVTPEHTTGPLGAIEAECGPVPVEAPVYYRGPFTPSNPLSVVVYLRNWDFDAHEARTLWLECASEVK